MEATKICLICENEGKYKCPQCFTHNCSLTCFKAHKEQDKCQQALPAPVIVEDKRPDKINFFATVDTVPKERLQRLAGSEKLKEILKNPHLRKFLQEIDSAPNSWNAMKLAMIEPLFLEFGDECLNIVEPQIETTE